MFISTRIVRWTTVVVATAALLNGCSAANLGIRPDLKELESTDTACDQFAKYITYSQDLQEAYHSRAAQNRNWVYVAGTLALGTLGATGGLGLVGASALALGIVSLSGGFTSGVFAIADNQQIAIIYTAAANEVNDALSEARAKMVFNSSNGEMQTQACQESLNTLIAKVTLAKDKLESARTDSAVAAVARGQAQLEALKKQLETPTRTATATTTPTQTPSPSPTK